MIVIALAYAVHLISIPADWSPATPRVSISGPPRYAAVASGGSIAVLLKPATSLSGNATRLLVIRANGTRVMLQVQVPAIIERFGEHGKGSTCRAGNDDCPHFENVTLARDGTPFVTVAYVNGGAYPGVRRLAFVWNGQWHAIPKGSAVPAIGRPNAPDNFSIAAADSVERFAYVADFADGFPSEDLVLAARERSYMADVSGMQYSSRVARLGLGNAAAMRGQFLAGFEAGMKLVRGDPHSVAIRWHCDFANPAFVGI
ncbi:MAG TPA: hypothetical protein VHR97_09550, partial [Candidatus Baltobacteraceae bacterium]|nr:hypothetical protein [Candidatus Baltobacteraceae bacterium]